MYERASRILSCAHSFATPSTARIQTPRGKQPLKPSLSSSPHFARRALTPIWRGPQWPIDWPYSSRSQQRPHTWKGVQRVRSEKIPEYLERFRRKIPGDSAHFQHRDYQQAHVFHILLSTHAGQGKITPRVQVHTLLAGDHQPHLPQLHRDQVHLWSATQTDSKNPVTTRSKSKKAARAMAASLAEELARRGVTGENLDRES